ncbi:hypothetical protein GTZ99_16470 [Novosphingobium sp. FSY-8]|uniref:Uncharacterized protein n=1 Tax=Novosphingobium ovatum TaxID=1908523 RepID=A0ABW9XI18_9SPHN|nr:hypothetical protein [Novosphingobium ovatum]NBC38146.1 hypothetical protein [Novosphingobium ovatum]
MKLSPVGRAARITLLPELESEALDKTPYTAGRREITGLSVLEDQALAMIAALASELAVARERIDTLERMLEDKGAIDRTLIDSYAPDAAAAAERDGIRQRMIAKIFRPLRDATRRAIQEKTA